MALDLIEVDERGEEVVGRFAAGEALVGAIPLRQSAL